MKSIDRPTPHAYTAQAVYPSRFGPLLLARTATGLAGTWFEGQRHFPPVIEAPHSPDDPLLMRARDQLAAYFDGSAAAFDVPLDLLGTAFQRSVWAALLAVARGGTCTYGEIARSVGKPVAARAVGAAVGRNPVSIFVPCHRIVGRNGDLTGYAGGLDRKLALLELEGVRGGVTKDRTAAQA